MAEAGITLTEFAAIMGVHPAQPTRWAAKGMPLLPSGRVEAAPAAAWVRRNIDPTAARHRSLGARQAAGDRPRDPVAAVARLAARLAGIAIVARLPETAAAVGVPLPAVYALHHAMQAAGGAAVEEAVRWCGFAEELEPVAAPLPELEAPDWPAMAAAEGVTADLAAWQAAAVARFGPLLAEEAAD